MSMSRRPATGQGFGKSLPAGGRQRLQSTRGGTGYGGGGRGDDRGGGPGGRGQRPSEGALAKRGQPTRDGGKKTNHFRTACQACQQTGVHLRHLWSAMEKEAADPGGAIKIQRFKRAFTAGVLDPPAVDREERDLEELLYV